MMSSVVEEDHGAPIFKAVSSSARQLFQLLNCIRFAPKAQVQISNEGLRFAVEESRVMQGMFIEESSSGSHSNIFRNRLSGQSTFHYLQLFSPRTGSF